MNNKLTRARVDTRETHNFMTEAGTKRLELKLLQITQASKQ